MIPFRIHSDNGQFSAIGNDPEIRIYVLIAFFKYFTFEQLQNTKSAPHTNHIQYSIVHIMNSFLFRFCFHFSVLLLLLHLRFIYFCSSQWCQYCNVRMVLIACQKLGQKTRESVSSPFRIQLRRGALEYFHYSIYKYPFWNLVFFLFNFCLVLLFL